MDSATVSNLAQSFSLAVPLLIAAAFAWAIYRAGSRQVVVRRLWQLVHGKQEIADPQIRAFVEEEASLLSFRMLAGIPVSTLEKAHQLVDWTKSNGVQMHMLRLCGDLFDPDSRQIRIENLPSKWALGLRCARLLLCVFLAVASAGVLFFDRTLMKINATERHFFATTSGLGSLGSAIPFGPSPLKAADCSRPASANAARTAFTEREVEILCGVLKASETPAYLKMALNDQRWESVKLLLISAVLTWMSFFSWASGFAAHKLAKRGIDPSISGTQLNLALHD
ncbi:hypothetical protein J2X90_003738 [Variovorax paradoxus]|uniref:DUF6216 family protein n=1 Tax=Variovorax paradoxus TaxID=34073 RepID=UPI0027876128|nr:DUF6216 family protein [Variovorax paradoxus]MDQ0025915.1 hypothetical protein [Variovorax paradoxus]